jgi:hypothetical protein
MKHADHEDGRTERETYCALADLYNLVMADIALIFVDSDFETDIEDYLTVNAAYTSADLTNFTQPLAMASPSKSSSERCLPYAKK